MARDKISVYELQLGHGFFSVEIARWYERYGGLSNRFNWATDFSPWKFNVNRFHDLSSLCFNWATDFSPWKSFVIMPMRYDNGDASIGPRIFLRGNLVPPISILFKFVVLQLGHGFFSVEIRQI